MINSSKEWNPNQALLKNNLLKSEKFNEAIKLCLEMHSFVHTSEMSGINQTTYEDELWTGLNERQFRSQLNNKGVTIAWNLWHITRIEDLISNILIANDSQVMNKEWLVKLNTKVLDTGNAMTDKEIDEFSSEINMKELRSYRIEVGRKTQNILRELKATDLKRKMSLNQLNRILDEGGILEVEGSKWLIDFWSRKTVSGLLLMPITRHQMVHLNDSIKIKRKIKQT